MVMGQIIHKLFQFAISSMEFTVESLHRFSDNLMVEFHEQLYFCELNDTEALHSLKQIIPTIMGWKSKFLDSSLNLTGMETPQIIDSIMDIEETLLSPCYGLKGNVDVTLSLKSHDQNGHELSFVTPLEIKSGKNNSSLSHKAQAMLYSLIISEKYCTASFIRQ